VIPVAITMTIMSVAIIVFLVAFILTETSNVIKYT